jgi:hypothetical protein
MEKVERQGEPLGVVSGGQLLRGIVTGRNAAFFIDDEKRRELIEEDSSSGEVIKPLVVGGEIQPYRLERDEHWLLYLPHGVEIDRYPAVEDHLEDYRDELEGRATDQAWYELQQPQEAYRQFFDGPKILYPEIARDARFAFHPGPLYPNNKCFFIPGDDSSLVALLNSRLVYFYLAMPGGSTNPARDLAPFNDVLISVATSPAVASLALLGTVGFVWEVRANGFLPRDERTLRQKLDDMRRERAKESHVWSHPGVDSGTNVYQELPTEAGETEPDYPTAEGGDLALIGHGMTASPRRAPKASVKTSMKRPAVITGASTVCVATEAKRRTSRA